MCTDICPRPYASRNLNGKLADRGPDLKQRLASFFLLIASAAFIFVLGRKLFGIWSVQHHFTTAQWIESAKIPLMLVAAVIAIRGLRSRQQPAQDDKGILRTLSEGADHLERAFRIRPVAAAIFLLIMAPIPFALLTLSRGSRWAAWETVDWIALGAAELAVLVIPAVALVRRIIRGS